MDELPPLLTVQEVRCLIGPKRVGYEAVRQVFRTHGFRLGNKLLLPRAKALALLEGRLETDLEEGKKEGA